MIQFEFFRLFKPITNRHLEERKRAPCFQGPIHARFWREWVDQRASSPERPLCLLAKAKGPAPPIRALKTARPHPTGLGMTMLFTHPALNLTATGMTTAGTLYALNDCFGMTVSDESFKHFVRQQSPTRRQLKIVADPGHQTGRNKLLNHRLE